LVDVLHTAISEYVLRLALDENPALVKNSDQISDPADETHVVLDDQKADCRLESQDEIADLLLLKVIISPFLDWLARL